MTKTLFLFVGLTPLLAYSQEPPPKEAKQIMAPGIMEPEFSADRPGLTDPSALLSVGMLQIESGFELSGSGLADQKSRQALLPQVLVRAGVFPRLELRVAADGYAQSTTNDGDAQSVAKGFSDGSVSAKIKVIESEAINFTIVPILSVPSNDSSFSTGTFDPAFELVFDRGIPLDMEIGVNFNGAVLSGEEGRFFEASGGVALARDVVGDLGAYVEIFGSTPTSSINIDWIANGGFVYVLENKYQLDIAYGKSLTTPGDFFFGFGFTARIMRWYY